MFRNIDTHVGDANRLALDIAQHQSRRPKAAHLAVLSEDAGLAGPVRGSGVRSHRRHQRRDAGAFFGNHKLRDRVANELLARPTGGGHNIVVAERKLSIEVDHEGGQLHIFEETTKAPLGFPQCLFGGLTFGDVTGKGLQAGMLVALIVGAIRSSAQHDNNPQRILEALNEQLCERESSSATCMVLRFLPDGTVELANAGQLPPYLNGTEMQIEGALPLGILPGMDFPVTSFCLEPGDSLLMMSDGVVEAQNERGELFGFERIEQMLRKPTTAAEIATAAQKFGQSDDILVMRVERNAAPAVLFTEPVETYS